MVEPVECILMRKIYQNIIIGISILGTNIEQKDLADPLKRSNQLLAAGHF